MPKTPLVVRIAKKGSLGLALETPPMPKFDSARCKDENLELFFSETTLSVEQAKRHCDQCPIAIDCRKWATRFAAFGVFGGTTPSERVTGDKELPYYDVQTVQEEIRDLTGLSITDLAGKYGVTSRTVSRWRETVSSCLENVRAQD
jgi:hypothetical protein